MVLHYKSKWEMPIKAKGRDILRLAISLLLIFPITLVTACMCTAPKTMSTPTSTLTPDVTMPTPTPTLAPDVTTPTVSPTNPVRTLTITDKDLPLPPIQGMNFHFVTPNPGDYGPGKIRASFGFISWSVWLGVSDGKLWLYHLPNRESLPQSLYAFYDSLGINEYATFTADGKYWLNGIPPWIDIAKYDPDVVKMPLLVAIKSTDGAATIDYVLNKVGDTNGNDVVDMGDVIKLERIILGLDSQTYGADVNNDGLVNMGDVIKIERIILGLD